MIEMLWLTTPSDRWSKGPRKDMNRRRGETRSKRRKVANLPAGGV